MIYISATASIPNNSVIWELTQQVKGDRSGEQLQTKDTLASLPVGILQSHLPSATDQKQLGTSIPTTRKQIPVLTGQWQPQSKENQIRSAGSNHHYISHTSYQEDNSLHSHTKKEMAEKEPFHQKY